MSALNWSSLRQLNSVLGEKVLLVYAVVGNVFYVLISIYPVLPIAGALPVESLPDELSIQLPVFFVIGFLQALFYFSARHIYHSAAPQPIKEKWDNKRYMEDLEARREFINQDAQSQIRAINENYRSAVSSLAPSFVSESVSKEAMQDFIRILYYNEKVTKILSVSDEKQAKISIEADELSKPTYRVVCSFLFFLSLIAAVAHVIKITAWVISTV